MRKKSKTMFSRKAKKTKSKTLKYKFRRLSFAKKSALIFVLMFALVGSAYLIKSFALDAGLGGEQVNRVNNLRASKGLSKLAVSQCLTAQAQAWADNMAAVNALSHNIPINAAGTGYACDTWFKLGENVGRAGGYSNNSEVVFNGFVASPDHYANMVDPAFNAIGVGTAYSGGELYVAQAFANCGACTGKWNMLGSKSTPPLGANYRGLAVARGATASQGYKINGRGELRTLDGKYVLASNDTWGWDAIRAVAVNKNWKGYKLDLYGGLHPFSSSGPSGAPAPATGAAYWAGKDIARDVKLVGAYTKGYVLDGYGALHKFNGAATPSTSAYWQGWDIANSFAINDAGTQGYVLDGYGGLHPFSTGSSPKPQPIKNGPNFAGKDLARKVVLSPNGKQGYVLDGFGGVHPFSQPGYCKPLSVSPGANGYISGFDIFVDIAIRSWGKSDCTTRARGHTIDVNGKMHDF